VWSRKQAWGSNVFGKVMFCAIRHNKIVTPLIDMQAYSENEQGVY
jgi:hypothetical protein